MSKLSEQELSGIESALRGLVPSLGDFDREALFFRAGQNAVRKHRWMWPLLSAGLASLAGTLAVLLALQRGQVVVERIVYLPAPTEAPDSDRDARPDSPPVVPACPVLL